MNITGVVPFEFDYVNPDYIPVFIHRARFLADIRKTKSANALKVFYRNNPIQFIIDWGVTFDPRHVEIGLPSKFPFIPFPRQIDWCGWVLSRWLSSERGVCEKSRGSGVSWLAVALSCTLCLFKPGISIGFGSRKLELVTGIGDPKSLFYKARMFMNNLPPEFRGGWDERHDARESLIRFPESESVMTGEGGDQIGRGDRTGMYFVDEAAFLEHPDLAESSLSDTTNCRIDISTSNGSLNAFYDRRMALPERQVFTFRYQDDPRRTPEWEAKKRIEVAPAVFDREFGISHDEGGAFFAPSSLLVDDAPVEDPEFLNYVFAVIDSATKTGKEHDGLAVTFFGVNKDFGIPAFILDWDLKQIEGALLIDWLPTVFQQLERFCKQVKVRDGIRGVWIEDKASGMILLQQAQNMEMNVHPIESKLTALGKEERAINVSGYVHQGQVKITRRAYERVVDFKGVTKNHLWAQIMGFRVGAKEPNPQDDCLDTFTYGCALSLGNSEGF